MPAQRFAAAVAGRAVHLPLEQGGAYRRYCITVVAGRAVPGGVRRTADASRLSRPVMVDGEALS
jgi:hypothetical protein